jgi:type IV pilus assembly protein PilP
MKRVIPFIIILSSLWLAAGCDKFKAPGSVPPPPPGPKKDIVTKPVQAVVTSAQIKPQAEAIDFSKKKDPFRPYAIVVTPKGKPNRSGLPIHMYEVNQFKIIGIITGLKENRAMIVDPNGKSYVVKVGMTIGIYEGRISKINPSSIEVVESLEDEGGKRVKRTVLLNLPRKQEFSR